MKIRFLLIASLVFVIGPAGGADSAKSKIRFISSPRHQLAETWGTGDPWKLEKIVLDPSAKTETYLFKDGEGTGAAVFVYDVPVAKLQNYSLSILIRRELKGPPPHSECSLTSEFINITDIGLVNLGSATDDIFYVTRMGGNKGLEWRTLHVVNPGKCALVSLTVYNMTHRSDDTSANFNNPALTQEKEFLLAVKEEYDFSTKY